MVGLLFIVNIPRKEYEETLRKKEQSKLIIDKEKIEKTSEIIRELKENKKFSSLISNTDLDKNISKCKSTDCLHTDDKLVGLYKSRSENTLSDSVDSKRTSFDEVKQIMKPRRNKLEITKPVRGIDILGAFHWDTPLETILAEIIESLNIFNATWNSTKDNKFWKVMFSLESGNLCEELLQVLRTFGIGSRHHSSVSVIPCSLYYKSSSNDGRTAEKEKIWQSDTNSAWTKFSSSVRARTNLAQVLHQVRADAALTFDWIFLLVVAAFVAAIGLVENSTVILVASMLISPLMGPITAGTLGTAVRDRSLQLMGFMHETLGLFLSLVIGFIFGLTICAVDETYGVGDWPTYEMMTRCEIRSLWVGVLIAIPSGAGVALAVLGDYTASLVGVAISASLLPPAVNAGLLWAMALVHLIYAEDETRWTRVVTTSHFSADQATELAVLGCVSLCLTLLNIVCIYIAGYAVYKVKEVCPLERRDISWWRANKNRLQASINRKNVNGWDDYSKWSNEPDEIKQEMVKKEPGLVHSDTVTYRRHQLHQRPRVQHIEDYCYQKEQTEDIYDDLKINSPTINPEDQNTNKKPEKNISWKDSTNASYDSKYNPDVSFYNMGFENDVNTSNVITTNNTHPVIEPSSNYTVDARNYGVVLEKKSFHV